MSEPNISLPGDDIEHARWIAVRGALKLEMKGLKRRGRSAKMLADRITKKRHKTRRASYIALNAKIVEVLGQEFDRPLEGGGGETAHTKDA